jgi:hypothetical protein
VGRRRLFIQREPSEGIADTDCEGAGKITTAGTAWIKLAPRRCLLPGY